MLLLCKITWASVVLLLFTIVCVIGCLDLANFVFQMFKRIQQQAAFIEFSQQHFDEAGQLFRESGVDVREVT